MTHHVHQVLCHPERHKMSMAVSMFQWSHPQPESVNFSPHNSRWWPKQEVLASMQLFVSAVNSVTSQIWLCECWEWRQVTETDASLCDCRSLWKYRYSSCLLTYRQNVISTSDVDCHFVFMYTYSNADTDRQKRTGNRQRKMQQDNTTLMQLPHTIFRQEMKLSRYTMLLSRHGASTHRITHWFSTFLIQWQLSYDVTAFVIIIQTASIKCIFL